MVPDSSRPQLAKGAAADFWGAAQFLCRLGKRSRRFTAFGSFRDLLRPDVGVDHDFGIETLPISEVPPPLMVGAAKRYQVRWIKLEFRVQVKGLFVMNFNLLYRPANRTIRAILLELPFNCRPMR